MKLFLIAVLFQLQTWPSQSWAQGEKILTSFSVIQSMTKSISGDDFLVESMVPNCSEIHDFQVRPQNLIKLKSAKIFISHGNGIDSWAKNLRPQGIHLELSKGMNLPYHSHAWLRSNILNQYLELITQKLIELKPDRKRDYLERLESTKKEVNRIYEKYRSQIKLLATDKIIITAHDYLSPLQNDFGLNIISLSKASDHESSGPRDLVRIHNAMTDRKAKILLLDQASPTLPASYSKYKLKESPRLHLECLLPAHQDIADYYESNLSLIADALK